MDSRTLVALMERFALRDISGGKGRIILPDFYDAVNETIDPLVMLQTWKQHRPSIPISMPTDNIIIIQFNSPYLQLLEEEKVVKERVVRGKKR